MTPTEEFWVLIATWLVGLVLVGLTCIIVWRMAIAAWETAVAAWGTAVAASRTAWETAERICSRWRPRGWTLQRIATGTAKVTAIVVCLVVLIFCYDLVMDKLRGRPAYCDENHPRASSTRCHNTDGIWPFT